MSQCHTSIIKSILMNRLIIILINILKDILAILHNYSTWQRYRAILSLEICYFMQVTYNTRAFAKKSF